MSIRILVVEDDPQKSLEVRHLLDECGCGTSADFAQDVHRAESLLSQSKYEVLILDLALPARFGQPIESDAGVRLLRRLNTDPRVFVPDHVLGLTALPEVFEDARREFDRALLSLLLYDPASNEWKASLSARLSLIASAVRGRQRGISFDKDVAFLCALKEPELAAILRLPWNWALGNEAWIPSPVHLGHIKFGDREFSGVAASCPRMGMPVAAVYATQLSIAFRPRLLVMAGVAMGIEGASNLGDVIVADPCWDYGCGKWVLRDDGTSGLEPATYQLALEAGIRHVAEKVAMESEWLTEIWRRWPGNRPPTPPRVVVGPLASGAAVVGDGQAYKPALHQQRKCAGLDMEAYSVMTAAAEILDPRPRGLVVKAVMDHGGASKSDSFKHYCAYVGAQVASRIAVESLAAFSVG